MMAAAFVTVIRGRSGAAIADEVNHVGWIERLRVVIAWTTARKERGIRNQRDFAGGRTGQIDRSGGIGDGQLRAVAAARCFLDEEVMRRRDCAGGQISLRPGAGSAQEL